MTTYIVLMCSGFIIGGASTAVALYFLAIRNMQSQIEEYTRYVMYDKNCSAASQSISPIKIPPRILTEKEEKDKYREQVYFKAIASGVADEETIKILGEKEPVSG